MPTFKGDVCCFVAGTKVLNFMFNGGSHSLGSPTPKKAGPLEITPLAK